MLSPYGSVMISRFSSFLSISSVTLFFWQPQSLQVVNWHSWCLVFLKVMDTSWASFTVAQIVSCKETWQRKTCTQHEVQAKNSLFSVIRDKGQKHIVNTSLCADWAYITCSPLLSLSLSKSPNSCNSLFWPITCKLSNLKIVFSLLLFSCHFGTTQIWYTTALPSPI